MNTIGQYRLSYRVLLLVSCKILFSVALMFFLSSCMVVSEVPEVSDSELQAEIEKQLTLVEQTRIARTQKLADLSWPLLSNNLEMCDDFVRYRTGLWMARKSSSSSRFFGLSQGKHVIGEEPIVWGVATNSPAATAGLQSEDEIVAIDRLRVTSSASARRLLATAAKEFSDDRTEPIEIRVLRDGARKLFKVTPVLACRAEVLLADGTTFNAFANGRHITVFNGVFSFLRSDEELQYILAHELAHNLSNHIVLARTRGVIGAIFDALALSQWKFWTNGSIGRMSVRAFTLPHEAEADYLALYLLANAGVDSRGVEDLWRRLAAEDLTKIGWLMTHPSAPERFVQIRKTRAEIQAKQQRNEALIPERK